MLDKLVSWIKSNLFTLRDAGALLVVITPFALVLGRAVADVCVTLTALFFLIESLRTRHWGWAKQPWLIAALSLWLYSVVRSAFVVDNGDAVFTAFAWVRYILFSAAVAPWVLSDEQNKRRLCVSLGIAVLSLSLDGLYQYFVGHDILGRPIVGSDRLTAFYKRAILGVTIANLFAPFVMWLLEKNKIYATVFAANLCFVVVLLSGDRMGLLMAMSIMTVWCVCTLIKAPLYRMAVILLTVLIVSATVASIPYVTKGRSVSIVERQFSSTVSSAKNVLDTPYGMVFVSALKVGADYPFFGVGMHQFRTVCKDAKYGPLTQGTKNDLRCFLHPHNIYMEWFSEFGGIGLLGFMGFAVTVLWGLVQRLRANYTSAILWGLAAMLAVRLFPFYVSTSFYHNWAAIPFWLMLGWAMSYATSQKSAAEKRS